MAPDIVPTSLTTGPDTARRGFGGGGGRRHRPASLLRRLVATGSIVALVALVAACRLVFPDGRWVTTEAIAGKPALAWNDPNDALTDSPLGLGDVGYVEQEYFFGGKAESYAEQGTWTADGMWDAQPATSNSFETRMLVRRPANPQ